MISIAFLSGIYAALQLPFLLPIYTFLLIPILGFLIFHIKKYRFITVFSSIFIIGFLWLTAHGHFVLSSELTNDLQGRDLIVIGTVNNLPETMQTKRGGRTRFVLAVEQLSHQGMVQTQYPKKIRISWYGAKSAQVKAGERWQFKVRLKQPHGMLNPGSFDYEKWLFERKIRATGYVKKADENKRLNKASVFSINSYRESLKNNIIKHMPNSDYRGIVLALTLGDKSQISDDQWQVFTATGTNHLVAISGLHIGLVAAAFYFMAGFLARRIPRILVYFPYFKIAALAAIAAAFFYAMLAGFAIPTQRALIMICVVMFFSMINQRLKASTLLSAALISVLLIDPFAVLSVGFWLSFIAVAAILFAMQSRFSANSLWWRWGRLQWIVSVALIPALLVTFNTFSVISPLANVIAVPWVSFLIVPLALISSVLSFIPLTTVIVDAGFFVTDALLHFLWVMMEYFAALPYAQWQQFSPQTWTLIPALFGVLLALSPKGFPAKTFSLFLLAPMFMVKPALLPENQFRFTLLDVGQGLAAVVQTKNHLLVFDAGPKFSSGFDTGEAVILPYLRTISAEKIDIFVVSHGDNDHIGGANSILQNIKVDSVLTSVPEKIQNSGATACLAGKRWQWDGVSFVLLNPNSLTEFGKKRKSGNNRSCVLKISSGSHSVLLTGDIEKKAEKKLLHTVASQLESTILIAPHHGSNTSSTNAFIQAVNPDYVLFPAGFRNRYGFPKPKVIARYQQQGIKRANTANTGAITFDISEAAVSTPAYYRETIRRFWHHL